MSFVALLALAFGPLNWSFPWWVWFAGIGFSSSWSYSDSEKKLGNIADHLGALVELLKRGRQ